MVATCWFWLMMQLIINCLVLLIAFNGDYSIPLNNIWLLWVLNHLLASTMLDDYHPSDKYTLGMGQLTANETWLDELRKKMLEDLSFSELFCLSAPLQTHISLEHHCRTARTSLFYARMFTEEFRSWSKFSLAFAQRTCVAPSVCAGLRHKTSSSQVHECQVSFAFVSLSPS